MVKVQQINEKETLKNMRTWLKYDFPRLVMLSGKTKNYIRNAKNAQIHGDFDEKTDMEQLLDVVVEAFELLKEEDERGYKLVCSRYLDAAPWCTLTARFNLSSTQLQTINNKALIKLACYLSAETDGEINLIE